MQSYKYEIVDDILKGQDISHKTAAFWLLLEVL